ncbi:MAG: cytochrome C [Aequorivita sp.]|nr:cytochrome C [Aequorivita sp.]|tara:strand:+ start:82312 stop:82785 length:474 start_codon:yes stop_codon:yes gene_type:complete
MKKVVKILAIVAVAILIGLQFFRPEKNNEGYESVAAFEAETKPSAKLVQVLKDNCYDCHSNETDYPWYAQVAPLSLWLDEHIQHGKSHFNVSEWNSYSLKKKAHKIEEVIEVVEKDEMPLPSYEIMHGDLSSKDKQLLLTWANMVSLKYNQGQIPAQ